MFSYSNYCRLADGVHIAIDLYRDYGDSDYIGENVSQLQHALQCAHLARAEFPERPEVIVGAFFHDIGHLIGLDNGKSTQFVFDNKSMDGLGLVNHEKIGGDFLDYIGLPKAVGNIARNHIRAKRYMITLNPDYSEELSEASKKTFLKQGGNFNSFQMAEFEKVNDHNVYLRCRVWDDLAKSTSFQYEFGLDYIQQLAEGLVISNN